MSILTKSEILKEIGSGRIKITPFSKKCVGPASVDLHLGNDFIIFKKIKNESSIVDVNKARVTPKAFTRKIHLKNGKSLILIPGETIFGVTKEKITLPPDICGWLEGRSRFARLGLLVHISANFMQTGIDNHQCFQIANFSPMKFRISPGVAICQFIFQKAIGEATYDGYFENQNSKNLW